MRLEDGSQILVEVAYARPDEQVIIQLKVAAKSTAGAAIRSSGVLQRFPEIDLSIHKVGVFGRLVGLDHLVCNGDRIEIYRPLIADPKESRRRRAAASKPAAEPSARRGGRGG